MRRSSFHGFSGPLRERRNESLQKIMKDPRMQPEANPMPFAAMRLIYGGFEPLVEA